MAEDLLENKNVRLDLFLFYIRLFKTRSLSTKYIRSKTIEISGKATKKPHKLIVIGDVLTIPKNDEIKILKVIDIPSKRGSFLDSLLFYEDLTLPTIQKVTNINNNKIKFSDRVGRPTKQERRKIDKLMGRD
jgi:ribosome-associated heat shock protein Hsp15|tara:strand:+ start:188 stop:583 length:396 start_codon:yes stop_codon:yes gene_type:complete